MEKINVLIIGTGVVSLAIANYVSSIIEEKS